MFCTACGTKNAAESRYCKQCGHPIDHMAAGRIREEDFDRALPEDEQLNALLERAYRARKTGDSAQAIALCQEALGLRPDSTTAHSLLGQIYESVGEREMAIRQYERVLQLNPGSIADRVKLDELRNGDLPAMHGAVPPHIVFADHSSRQSGSQILGWVALAGVLMLIGGGLTALWRGHNTPVIQMPANTAQGTQASVAPNSAPPSSGVQTPVGGSEGQKSAAVAPPSYNPYWNMVPPIIIQPPADSRGQANPSLAGAGSGRQGVADVRLPGPARSDAARGRIVLNPTDDPTDDKGTVLITVEDNKGKSKPTSVSPNSKPILNVSLGAPSSGSGSPVQTPPSYDARSFIAAGDEQKNSGDYDKALQSYTKALASAGDDLASVYQDIAHCYQLRGDKVSAIANYKSAIAEYHKLIDAKKQPEFAEDGIRVCEKAIKTCNN